MFTYLSKKIAIPNNTKLDCIAWHKIEGFVAIGGENGLLKVLKLDTANSNAPKTQDNEPGVGASGSASGYSRVGFLPSNLTMNLTLEGHSEPVQVIVWNENLDKLTTSDANGVIIVWMLYKSIWYEEMINNRNKSTVTGMCWSFDGSKICIVYEDGAVIVGAANGNRIWGKELKDVTLRGVQWSPEANMLLFNVGSGQLHLYDNQGNFMMRVLSNERENSSSVIDSEIVTLQWYQGRYGYIGENCPNILICYENGNVVLMRNINDEEPIRFNVNMHIRFASWNHNASVIAIGAERKDQATGLDKFSILFYNNIGARLHTLRLPGKNMTACSWEGTGLRLAITVDSHIFFANIHPAYKWCFIKRTLVFSTGLWSSNGIGIVFWDTHSNLVNTLYVRKLFNMAAYHNLCVLAVEFEANKNMLLLCDTAGTIVDEKFLEFRPALVAINSTHVIVTSTVQFLLWQYNNLRSNQVLSKKKEYFYHINDRVTGEEAVLGKQDEEKLFPTTLKSDFADEFEMGSINDIQCITCSDTTLLIGRKNGDVNHYELPNVSLVNKYSFVTKGVFQMIRINCNSTKAALINDGQLIVFSLRSDPGFLRGELIDNTSNENSRLERKDVWDIFWAADNPHMLAAMEKARLYVFRGMNPEEPISCSGYLCSFKDLEIKTALLDEIMLNPDNLNKNLIVEMEVKSLRDTRELLNKVGIKEARQFIVDNPHPRLWGLLAEVALKQLDLVTAEVAFVYCHELSGIEFIDQLNRNRNQCLVKAKIATFIKDFDEAERLYMECDRRDLVLELYKKLGDWFKVRQLMTPSMKADISKTKEIYNGIGYYYADRHNWANTYEYFTKSKNDEMLALYYYHMEQYDNLGKMINDLSSKDPLLLKLGDMLASVGLCAAAANAYAKYGEIQKAINFCTKQNEWELAVKLAKDFQVPQMGNVLLEYVNRLVLDKRLPQGIEVYQKANRYLDAAMLAFDHGKKISKTERNIIRVKKWFVFAAMLIDKHRKECSGIESLKFDAIIGNRWRWAVAYHLYGLAQINLYEGKKRKAFITAAKLREYDDIISERDVYSLLALTSRACQVYSMCSKSFVKLISSSDISERDRQRYSQLANSIFKVHPPKDKQILRKECVSCETMIPDWYSVCPSCDVRFPTCLVTGQPIMDPKLRWTCSSCLENADIREMADRSVCPLCNQPKINNN